MKAVRLESVGCARLVEVPPPSAAYDELLVRTGVSTICTSDINDLRANPFGISLPVIMGHEAAGTVAALGAGVRGFAPGDRVAAHPVHPCLRCESCRRGLGHLCDAMGHFAINRPGTFAEFFTVRQDRARKVPTGMDLAVAALAEPVAVCLEALHRARLAKGERLLILGDGPFGVLMSRLARRFGPARVVVAGHHDARLALATGAIAVNTRRVADAPAALREAGEGGYDAAILAVGRAEACRLAVDLLRPRGRVVVFSAIEGEVLLDLGRLHLKELEIAGACNDEDLFDDAMRALADPALAAGELVTHRFPIEKQAEALAVAGGSDRSAMKVAFVFENP